MSTTTPEFFNFVNGSWVGPRNGEWIDVVSPRNRQVIARVPRGAEKDVDDAVDAAGRAFPGWRDTAPRARGRLLQQIADAIEPHIERIARQIAEENGNALRTQARGEVQYAVDVFRYFGSVASETKGETIPLNAHVLDYSRREPIGVVGAIVPWNAPVQLASMKIAAALAAGNSLVLKAAEDAPLAVLEITRICADFLPAGVLNVLIGYGTEAGEALITHPAVRKLSFTGSTAVGKRVMAAAAERIVPVSLELGGKNPQIVFPDADEDWVAQGTVTGMRFVRQGQSCTAGSRLFVHRSIVDSFVEKVTGHLAKLKVGDPLDEATDMGAVVNQKQFDRVCSFIDEGLARNDARVAIGGRPPAEGPLSEGFYVEPTVFVGIENSWRIAQEEIFGPVMCVIPWDDEEEVVRMANDTHYGLSAFIWTHDIGKALRTAHSIDAGWVQVNQGGGQVLGQSYGGYKQSGIGREFSLEGMLEGFTERKHISVDTSR
ncbi:MULTISPECIES: aldehyde dehydrogenase family protein [Pseudonocardia]|uniref:Aldehyde dehydrogenase n=2 Tax=Pseudonocardia TaxID=1847 RepID=A0ABQ0S0Z9_9PSEU|nr:MULTISPECIES: aldehyde dehydrogenase family protein [Pseudonocardia]OSY36279.1 putative aldehyde dehydrogenase AldA [Pseudonocardia autotrophica]TDN73084.1 betaine-aldehyde dehydrogenase [Pseudonocardia autotrophica]BBG03804.1 aldehyde dehydrogenase [Pseudonocardia autotrophica]GEC26588.1 aldehyde dehydrogenase [Pseudonocardia saturnea]